MSKSPKPSSTPSSARSYLVWFIPLLIWLALTGIDAISPAIHAPIIVAGLILPFVIILAPLAPILAIIGIYVIIRDFIQQKKDSK